MALRSIMGETGKRFLWNVGTSFVARAAVKFLSFIVTIFIINYLGPENFGIYSIVLNFAMVWMVMMDFGWVDMMVREISRNPTDQTRYISTYLVAQFGLNIFSTAIFLCVILFSGYDPAVQGYMYIIALGLFLFGFSRPFHSLLIATESLDRIASLSFISSLLGSIVMLAGVFLRQPLPFFIWVFNLSIVLQGMFYFLFARTKLKPWSFRPALMLIKPIVIMSLPFTFLLVSNVLLKQIDLIMLSKMVSKTQCGVYASANKFVYPFLMFSESVHWSIFPILSREKDHRDRGFQRALTKTAKYLLAISGFISVSICILAADIIVSLLKADYHSGIILLRILIWYLPMIFLSRLLFYALVSLNRMKFLMSAYGVCLALFIGLNLVLVPRYSALGTALSLVGVNLLLLCALWVIPALKGFLHFWIESLPQLVGSLIVSGLSIVVVRMMAGGIPVFARVVTAGCTGALVFAAAVFMTGFISADEKRQLSAILKR